MKLTIAMSVYDSFDNVVEVLDKLHAQIDDPNEVEVRIRNDNPSLYDTKLKETCTEYSFHYDKNEQNIGESMSRQRNLSDAEGEYLAWIDADDQITDDYVSTILSEIETCQADIIMHRWRFRDGREGDQHPKPLANWNVWANVYRTELVKNIKFDPLQVYSSDYFWLEKVVREKNPTIYYSDKSVNIYNDGNYNSLTHRFQRGEIKARLDE